MMPTVVVQPTTQLERPIVDVFAVTSWQPAAPVQSQTPASPPPVVAPAPPPAAPPLPFRFIGCYGDGELQLAMLAAGDKLYLVARGDIIEATYRVDSITAPAIELTYLPSKLSQRLATDDPR